jgi:ATP phosphoribosyltransferase
MISLALPKGSSLEKRTLDLFAVANLPVIRPSAQSQRATVDFDGAMPTAFYKPREIPGVVEQGHFDLGLTGADWIEEADAKVEVVSSFGYSKATNRPWRIVLAVPADHPARTTAELPAGVRVATEYTSIARRHFSKAGIPARIVTSFGATEGKIPELADAIIDVVETGTSLRHNGLRVLETIRTCQAQLIANPVAWENPAKRERITALARLLNAAHAGPEQALLTVQVPLSGLKTVCEAMPDRSWRAGASLGDEHLVVLQGISPKHLVARTVTALMAAGAEHVVESTVASVVESGADQTPPE